MREEHKEQIERWANFIREHPNEWKEHHKRFIDAKIEMARRFYKRLAETPEGKEKVLLLRSKQ